MATCAADAVCKPKGYLTLDKPYPKPKYYSPALPFCQQFQCSCCNISHAMAIQRSLQDLASDPSFSRRCLDVMARLKCYVCDPEVGTGSKAVCSSLCERWLHACQDDFFVFSDMSKALLPCAGATQPLLCSKLGDMVQNGEDLCELAGYSVSDEPCYDGMPSSEAFTPCAEAFKEFQAMKQRRVEVTDKQDKLQVALLWLLLGSGAAVLWTWYSRPQLQPGHPADGRQLGH